MYKEYIFMIFILQFHRYLKYCLGFVKKIKTSDLKS